MKTARPLSPKPVTGPRNGDLPAFVSNGLVGLRVREQPLAAGVAIVSGLPGTHPERRIEAAAPAPYPLAGDLAIDGVWLSDQPWSVGDMVQAYDFGAGELSSEFVFRTPTASVRVEVVTFASRSAPCLVLQQVRMIPDRPCDLVFRAVVETAGLRGRVVDRRCDTPGEDTPVVDGHLLWETEGGLGRCGLALHTELFAGEPAERSVRPWDESGPLVTQYAARATPSRPLGVRQMTALVPSLAHARPHEEAVRRLARGRQAGFESLREQNRAAWDELWKGRITVRGAEPGVQELVDAAFFYLNSSTHPASVAATSIFGLAAWPDYHYYFGHVMWDIDAFCTPTLSLLQPGAARSLLDFRSRGLEAARVNARLADREGFQFPWEAAPLSGEEASPGEGSGAAHEDHVSLHVARAFSVHADATGDGAFLRHQAWPVLRGVADWIVSRCVRTERGCEMKRAMGPAEVPEPPDNDALTLMAAGDILRRAARAAERLGEPSPPAWLETAEALYLPVRRDGAVAAHDGFRIDEPKGATPSPLAGYFPYDHPGPETQRRATLGLYLARWRDYVGSPMFPALYGVWAAMAGDRDLALTLFEEGYAAYDSGRFHQCLEYRRDHPDSETPAGPFFANLGGLLLGLVFGYTGLVVDDGDPEAWARRPVVLPRGWSAIEIDRLWVRGKPARLVARHGADRAELTFPELGAPEAGKASTTHEETDR